MYLEGIFVGGDIRVQLPEEAKKFDDIDKAFRKVSNEKYGRERHFKFANSYVSNGNEVYILKLQRHQR